MSDVNFHLHSGIGRITLNRPKALNALTHDMVLDIAAQLAEWRDDPAVRAVLVEGSGDRGLCAGGDIRSIYDDARAGGSASLQFWADEYRLNATIARYPKPYIAIMDGLVMGGGVGVSAHGSHRIVTERSRIGMPEVGIGFIPDVGGSYLLSRAPGQLGTHAALSTCTLSAADAIHCGLADFFVSSEELLNFFDDLGTQVLATAIDRAREPAPPSELAAQAEWIDRCYAADTVEQILATLHDDCDDAIAAAKEIERKSPVALKVALRALRTAAALPTLEDVLSQEYRISRTSLRSADLVEGIRAQIVDRDRAPRWTPPTLAEVDAATVDSYFAELGNDELLEATR